MDALTTSNLEDTLRLEKKRDSPTEKDWDKMNRIVCGLIRSCLTQDIRYHMLHETSARQLWEILEKEVSDEEHQVAAAVEEEVLSLPDEERTLH